MNQRPKILVFIAFVTGMIVLSFPIQMMVIYQHHLTEVSEAFAKLTSLNWLVMIGGGVSAYLVARASPLVKYFVPMLIGLVGINNWVVSYYATDYSPMSTQMATLGFMALNLPLLHPAIRMLIQHPDRRWWMRAERKRISTPIFVGGSRDVALRAETFDLSESGAFIPLSRVMGRHSAEELTVDEKITISLSLGAFSQVRCEGRVVRLSEARGIYPAGVGIEFTSMGSQQKRELKKYLERATEVQS